VQRTVLTEQNDRTKGLTEKQIASAANVNEDTVGRYCKLIVKALPYDSHVRAFKKPGS